MHVRSLSSLEVPFAKKIARRRPTQSHIPSVCAHTCFPLDLFPAYGDLSSGAFAFFQPFLFFEDGVVKIARDVFRDRFVGEFRRAVVLCYLKDKYAAFEA
jgi:hypothetical protein